MLKSNNWPRDKQESDSDDEEVNNNDEQQEDHPVYWRKDQQQPIETWLANHPTFTTNHPAVNKPAAQLFQNSVQYGVCKAVTTTTLNQPNMQFLIQYDDGYYAPMTTAEFDRATEMYQREHRIRQPVHIRQNRPRHARHSIQLVTRNPRCSPT